MAIGGYFIMVIVVILLMTIGVYLINGYCRYYINDNWCLSY